LEKSEVFFDVMHTNIYIFDSFVYNVKTGKT